MISLSQTTVSHTAPANTAVGTFRLLDDTGTSRGANWALTPGAASYFDIQGGNVLTTIRPSIPARFYAVKVRANGQNVALKEKARFVIQVM